MKGNESFFDKLAEKIEKYEETDSFENEFGEQNDYFEGYDRAIEIVLEMAKKIDKEAKAS